MDMLMTAVFGTAVNLRKDQLSHRLILLQTARWNRQLSKVTDKEVFGRKHHSCLPQNVQWSKPSHSTRLF